MSATIQRGCHVSSLLVEILTYLSLMRGSVPLRLSRKTYLQRKSCRLCTAAPHIIGTLYITTIILYKTTLFQSKHVQQAKLESRLAHLLYLALY